MRFPPTAVAGAGSGDAGADDGPGADDGRATHSGKASADAGGSSSSSASSSTTQLLELAMASAFVMSGPRRVAL